MNTNQNTDQFAIMISIKIIASILQENGAIVIDEAKTQQRIDAYADGMANSINYPRFVKAVRGMLNISNDHFFH